MNEVGLSMVIDPRWIVAVPENHDVAAEVARQMGTGPDDVNGDAWTDLVGGVGSMLHSALEDGASWSGVWLAADATDDVVLARAALKPVELPGPITAEDLLQELTVVHADDEYVAELAVVDTLLGHAVRTRQVIGSGNDLTDSVSYCWPRDRRPLVLEAFCTRVGWAGLWGAQLEAMAQTVREDRTVSERTVQMVVYVSSDEAGTS